MSNSGIRVRDVLERTWVDAVEAQVEVLFQHVSAGNE
jgi:hypothetical protein